MVYIIYSTWAAVTCSGAVFLVLLALAMRDIGPYFETVECSRNGINSSSSAKESLCGRIHVNIEHIKLNYIACWLTTVNVSMVSLLSPTPFLPHQSVRFGICPHFGENNVLTWYFPLGYNFIVYQ